MFNKLQQIHRLTTKKNCPKFAPCTQTGTSTTRESPIANRKSKLALRGETYTYMKHHHFQARYRKGFHFYCFQKPERIP